MKSRVIQQRANRQAASYQKAHFLQRAMAERLLQRLDYVRMQPEVVLDLGCATGWLMPALRQRYPDSHVLGLDFALQRLLQADAAANELLCADAHAMPLQSATVDLIVANDSLHWFQEPGLVMQECLRILKPGGLLMFTTLGPDSLQELRYATMQSGLGNRVHAFTDMHDIGDALVQAGFSDPVLDREEIQLQYRSIAQLCKDLHHLAAGYAQDESFSALVTPRQWQRFIAAYPTDHPELYPCTIELLQGQAWKGEQATGFSMNDKGEVAIPLVSIKR